MTEEFTGKTEAFAGMMEGIFKNAGGRIGRPTSDGMNQIIQTAGSDRPQIHRGGLAIHHCNVETQFLPGGQSA